MDLDAHRGENGTYAVASPEAPREPTDWLLVAWVAVGTVGIAMPFVGATRWLTGW